MKKYLFNLIPLIFSCFILFPPTGNLVIKTQNIKTTNNLNDTSLFDCEIVSDNEVLLKEKNLWDQAEDIFIPHEIIFQNKYYYVKGVAANGFINNSSHIKSIIFEKNKNFTDIGENSFKNLNLIDKKDIELPPTIERIGKNAFANSTNLEKINFDSLDNLITIGDNAFADCINLTSSVILGKKLIEIGSGAFQNDKNIQNIVLKKCENLKKINSFAFFGCSKNLYNELVLNDSLETIGEKAFSNISFEEIIFNFSISTIDKISFGTNWNPTVVKKIFFPYTTIDLFLLKTNFGLLDKKKFIDGLPITSIVINSSTDELIYNVPTDIAFSVNYGAIPSFKVELVGPGNLDLEIIENIYTKNFTLTLKKWHLFNDKISLRVTSSVSNFENNSSLVIGVEKEFSICLFGKSADNIFIGMGSTLTLLNTLCLFTIIYLLIIKKQIQLLIIKKQIQ